MQSNDFSVVVGGPLYQAYQRLGLLKPPLKLVRRRVIVITAFAWVPLLVMTALAGEAWGGVTVPFLGDLAAQVRLLIALPLLISSELIIHKSLSSTVGQFLESDLVPPEHKSKFEAAITSALRWRNSVFVELLILVLSFTAGYWIWRQHLALHVTTWYFGASEVNQKLTPAGLWYALISLSILRFLLGRWCYRLFLWHRFLWHVSRIPLRINPLHPDRAGGLDFLGYGTIAFAPLMVVSALLSGEIGDHVLRGGATLPNYYLEIVCFVLMLLILILLSQVFFTLQMLSAKSTNRRDLGIQGMHTVEEFRKKWLTDESGANKTLLGSDDVSSLADLGSSFSAMLDMRLLPISFKDFLILTGILVTPLLPLALTMIPLSEIIERLFKVFV